jgi:cell division protein FtsN
MYKKLAILITIILLFFLSIPQIFAAGVKNPVLVVRTPSETSRLISMDWSNIHGAEQYRWGLYRFDLEEKSFVLLDELMPFQSSYLDENIEPPLSKYYYKVEHTTQKASLEKTEPERLDQNDVQEQLKSIFQISAGMESGNIAGEIPINSGRYVTNEEENDWQTAASNVTYSTKPANNSAYFNEGIYIGAISFSGRVSDITHNPDRSPALVLLDGTGRQALLENLARGYLPSKSSGTALYYADHKALTNLSMMKNNGSLPSNIDSVTIITFTDGIDTSSTDINFPPLEGRQFKSGNAYNAFISQQLKSNAIRARLPGVKKFNAWSIGIPGKDVQNNVEFGRGLQAVGPDDFSEFTNVSQIEKVLLGIADKLLLTYKPRVNFTLSTPAYPIGTKLRITFDGYAAEASTHYIEARVLLDENTRSYILSVTEQFGIKLTDEKPRLEGKRNETGIDYTMLLTDEFQESKVRQWYIQPGEEAFGWMQNSEFATNKTADFTYERKSEIIYLVLDCSSSLNEKEIDSIRSAVGVFINRLYSALYDPAAHNIGASAKQSIAQAYPAGGKPPQAVSELYIQTYKPGAVVSPPQSSGYQTQTYTQSMGSGAPPAIPSSISRTQTYTGQAAPNKPVSEIIIQTYKQPDSASRLPQTTIPSGQLNKAPSAVSGTTTQVWQRTNTEHQFPPPEMYQMPSIQPRPSNRTQPESGTPVIGALSVSNAPVNSSSRGAYWVQLGSYSDTNRAQRSWREFSNTGIGRAEIFSTNVNGTTYFRVKAGPYQIKEEAERALARLRSHSSMYNDSFVTNE